MAVVSLMVVPPTSYAQVRPQVREAAPAGTDWNAPRTPWGAPDLQGIWDYRTATPLERPAEFASKETLTEEEAAAYEENTELTSQTTTSHQVSTPNGGSTTEQS